MQVLQWHVRNGWRKGRAPVHVSSHHERPPPAPAGCGLGDRRHVVRRTNESESPGFDNQPVLCQALNVAQAINEAGGSRSVSVLLPKPEVYGYFGTIEVPDGLTIRGAGGTYLATATDDLGNTYRPVRIRDAHTTLRVLDGEALKLPPDARGPLRTPFTSPRRKGRDGDAPLSDHGRKQRDVSRAWRTSSWTGTGRGICRRGTRGGAANNSRTGSATQPGWSGFTATAHGKDIPLGQEFVIRNSRHSRVRRDRHPRAHQQHVDDGEPAHRGCPVQPRDVRCERDAHEPDADRVRLETTPSGSGERSRTSSTSVGPSALSADGRGKCSESAAAMPTTPTR